MKKSNKKAYLRIYYQNNKEKLDKQHKKYYKNNPWINTLHAINQRCKNSKHKFYKFYGGRGIKSLITSKELKFLWFRDKAYNMKKPSIDRIDSKGNYTFENCRYIEQKYNTGKELRKPILQFSLDGEFINEWESVREVSRKLKLDSSSIYLAGNGIYKTSGGFIWKYKNSKKEK